jgi:hypothetical protein
MLSQEIKQMARVGANSSMHGYNSKSSKPYANISPGIDNDRYASRKTNKHGTKQKSQPKGIQTQMTHYEQGYQNNNVYEQTLR